MANLNIFAGMDISKTFFDISILSTGKVIGAARLCNDQAGYNQLKSVLPAGAHCVMEATGPYYLRLACWLQENDFTVSVINPLSIRRFAQMKLRRVKTDKEDATIIAQYGYINQPPAWTPPTDYIVELQQLDAMREGVIMHLRRLRNPLEAFTASGMLKTAVAKTLKSMIAQQQKALERLEEQTEQIIRQHYQQTLNPIPIKLKKLVF